MNKKYAFTVTELVVVLVLAGFVMLIEMMILNTRINQYSAPYYNAYLALKKAAYNVLADMYCPGDDCPDSTVTTARPFPTTTEGLCSRLTEFINTEEKNCSSNNINDDAGNFSDTTLQFIATNGFKFYISGYKKISNVSYYGSVTSPESTVNYFIVYVDINGGTKPNRVDKTASDKVLPDIVPFAVTTRGDVIPMGYPIYSNTYLTARIKYPAQQTGSEIDDNRYSPAYNFYEAINRAWGGSVNANIPFSIDFTSQLSSTSKARNFYSIPSAASIDSSEGCSANTYTCRVVVDMNDTRRY